MAHIVRCISDDGCVVVLAADTSDIVEAARQINDSSKVCTAALGRLLTASSLMGVMLKGEESSVTLRVNGNGPVGSVIAVADKHGNARGYIMDSHVELPLNEKGKLDVGGAVGKKGFLTVIKDVGLKEPSMGQVPLVSGEIAEDITSYFGISEQIPSVCGLGVLVNGNKTVSCAGGFLIQLLPTADDEIIGRVEKGLENLIPVTTMLSNGMTPFDICKAVLPDFNVEILDETDCEYRCNCSRKKVEQALITTGRQSLTEMMQDEITEVKCHFCPSVYKFTPDDIGRLLKEATN